MQQSFKDKRSRKKGSVANRLFPPAHLKNLAQLGRHPRVAFLFPSLSSFFKKNLAPDSVTSNKVAVYRVGAQPHFFLFHSRSCTISLHLSLRYTFPHIASLWHRTQRQQAVAVQDRIDSLSRVDRPCPSPESCYDRVNTPFWTRAANRNEAVIGGNSTFRDMHARRITHGENAQGL